MKCGATICIAAALAVLAGCEEEPITTPEQSVQVLRANLTAATPEGWQVSLGREVPFDLLPPSGPDDLIVWRSEEVELKTLTPDNPTGKGHLYFTLSIKEFIDPRDYPVLYHRNEEIRKRHEQLLHGVSNMPRDPAGRLAPRSLLETTTVNRYYGQYHTLPPYEPSYPEHYFGKVTVKLWDWRTVLVPRDLEIYKDLSRAYLAITKELEAYGKVSAP